jgi:hypothetical protein
VNHIALAGSEAKWQRKTSILGNNPTLMSNTPRQPSLTSAFRDWYPLSV